MVRVPTCPWSWRPVRQTRQGNVAAEILIAGQASLEPVLSTHTSGGPDAFPPLSGGATPLPRTLSSEIQGQIEIRKVTIPAA